MYRVTCDGFPLLDWRDNDLFLVAPKVRLEVNTVGEGSFTIYKQHPYFDKLARLKSVIEVSDETGVIFRGRATGDSIDFDHGMEVDMEGALAYFNDSIVRPFSFPEDFKGNAKYIAAEKSGNVISFFLGWLIDNHNAQVKDFQKLKLGNVTVTDPNNYISRSSSEHASTWEVLRSRLFESSLGGYLCIRYEADGNYIDYLSEFTETNSQEIVFGENLLDLTREAEASGIYTAMLPVGALGLTVANLDDGDWSDDIVKSGDSVYSKKAVAQYGWIYAPVNESTWDDVTQEITLLTNAAKKLGGNSVPLHAIEATAVDLHFTDAQVESLRIYKNVKVQSAPHGLSEIFPLSKLEINLNEPQKTKITVGKQLASWTEIAALREEETKLNFSKMTKTDEEIRLLVQGAVNEETLQSSIEAALGTISLSVSNGSDSSSISLLIGETVIKSQTIKMSGMVTISGLSGGTTTIDGACIKTGTISANRLNVSEIRIGDLLDDVGLVTSGNVTTITKNAISTAYISASQITTGILDAEAISLDGILMVTGEDAIGNTATGYIGANPSKGAVVMASSSLQVGCLVNNSAAKLSYYEDKMIWVHSGGCYSSETMQVFSDRTLKNEISYDLAKEEKLFRLLRPCSFVYNSDQNSKKHWGFIAQDFVESAKAVGMDTAALAVIGQYDGKYSLGYGEVTALNTLMIQKLMERMDAMEKAG